MAGTASSDSRAPGIRRQRLSPDGVGHGEAAEAVHLLTGSCRRVHGCPHGVSLGLPCWLWGG